jgi:hypothetical protein
MHLNLFGQAILFVIGCACTYQALDSFWFCIVRWYGGLPAVGVAYDSRRNVKSDSRDR